ncbi:MAG: DUF1572 family protein [Bacteroidota bacterium]
MQSYLPSVRKQFEFYQVLGTNTFDQLSESDIHWKPDPEANSIAIIVGHIYGNQLSRWTDFLTTDGEKEWRDRDREFEPTIQNMEELREKWKEGWNILYQAIDGLTVDQLASIIYIRNEGHTVIEAINRQLSHYAYHVGQIVYLGRIQKGQAWESLSVPKGTSKAYNQAKFTQTKARKHFTDEWIKA